MPISRLKDQISKAWTVYPQTVPYNNNECQLRLLLGGSSSTVRRSSAAPEAPAPTEPRQTTTKTSKSTTNSESARNWTPRPASEDAGTFGCARCGGLVDVVLVNGEHRTLDGGILCACGTREDNDESSARALRACALDSESGWANRTLSNEPIGP